MSKSQNFPNHKVRKLTSNDLIEVLIGASQIAALVNRSEPTPCMQQLKKELMRRLDRGLGA